ncbi:NUDIX domain-containing protein [Kitasatospora sp. NPDC008050]|uniref:NUDIX hydrolase n=1 Tax=Kitasatospora sp. NPDC008050 TaxID=3364021 RepID=UPI0036E578EC
MAIPPFLAELRALVGTGPLWLSSVCTVVLDDQDQVLLGRRADSGAWALVGGIIDPGEQPADAAVRECYEETGVHVVPELLTSVTVSPQVTYPNGDRTQYLEITFRCRAVGGEARVNDEESLEVAWFAQDALPELDASNRERLKLALECTGRTAFSLPGAAG